MSELTYVQEYNAIAEVLNKYLDGNAKGNSAATKLAFHEKATIFGVNGNDVLGPEIQKLYDIVDTLEPSPNARTAIARMSTSPSLGIFAPLYALRPRLSMLKRRFLS